jgi:hypothetical protein
MTRLLEWIVARVRPDTGSRPDGADGQDTRAAAIAAGPAMMALDVHLR